MKKAQQKLMKKKLCIISRAVACASFLILTVIAVSSLVRAMSLEKIANENGIPASWQIASLGTPDTISIPATFWDQRQDSCDAKDRQFEWVICGYWTKGALQGIVKNTLGKDGLPIPAFTNSIDAWNANFDVFTANVTGHDPVLQSDNFYRWFHEVPGLSQRIDGREVTFTRVGNTNTYVYGRDGIFPLDDVDFSKSDEATKKNGHNYHFTSHVRIPVKISADGTEEFYFSGDDDVWVFLNDQLVIDLGGLHEKLEGNFRVNEDGTVTTYVQHVNDVSGRVDLGEPSNSYNDYVNPLNEYIMKTYQDVTKTIDIGLHQGDVVNLDFFYAERSTTESNTNITIKNMNWPISADSDVEAKIIGKIDDTNNKLVRFNSNIKNRDPENGLELERLAAYIEETTVEGTSSGYLPLDETSLFYTVTPNDENSWQPVSISAPDNSERGFKLDTPIHMAPAGQPGDTLYFRYFGETSEYSGTMSSTVSYYTSLDSNVGVTYDNDEVTYTEPTQPTTPDPNPEKPTPTTPEPPTTPETPDPDPTTPEKPNPNPEVPDPDPTTPENPNPETPKTPTTSDDTINQTPVQNPTQTPTTSDSTPSTSHTTDLPSFTTIPGTNLIDGNLLYLAPLGAVAFAPNTGIVSDTIASLFHENFAEVILSQTFVMVMLLIFAKSFAVYFTLRKFLAFNPATRTVAASTKKMPKMSTKSPQNLKRATIKSAKTSAKKANIKATKTKSGTKSTRKKN